MKPLSIHALKISLDKYSCYFFYLHVSQLLLKLYVFELTGLSTVAGYQAHSRPRGEGRGTEGTPLDTCISFTQVCVAVQGFLAFHPGAGYTV